jgi:hypothetical protein
MTLTRRDDVVSSRFGPQYKKALDAGKDGHDVL